MAYEAHEWKDGDTITADLLNSLEQGVGNEQAGPQDATGKSAFEIWHAQDGNADKTEDDFIASLKGDKGDAGTTGKAGTAAPTITGLAIDAAAGKDTLTLSDGTTVDGTYTAAAK
jgi:hypothetical protein